MAAYATVQNMIDRFGATEIIRLSTPADQEMDGVVASIVEARIADASAIADSYIRQRYETPVDPPPPELTFIVCDMARYELSSGDGKTPAQESKDRNDRAMRWLKDIANGAVKLDLTEVNTGTESFAKVALRSDEFGQGSARAAPFGRGEF